MISKKRLTLQQRLLLRAIDAAEQASGHIKWTMFLVASIFVAVFIHKQTNAHILNNCDRTIYQVVETATAFGPAYTCVSRVQMQGPPVPIKD